MTKSTQQLDIFDESSRNLEWPVVLEELTDRCLTPYGKTSWQLTPFLESAEAIMRHQAEVDAVKVMLMRFPMSSLTRVEQSVFPILEYLVKDGRLIMTDLTLLWRSVLMAKSILKYVGSHADTSPTTRQIEGFLKTCPDITECDEYLKVKLDDRGELLDSASVQYGKLIAERSSLKQQVKDKLSQLLRNPDLSKAFENNQMTERNNRLVLPVKTTHKSMIAGVVHDTSGSGATIFVEPQSTVKLNQELMTLERDIENEVRKMLTEISEFLSPQVPFLHQHFEFLAKLDRRLSAAQLSIDIDATPVEISRDGVTALRQAKHPLLVLSMGKKHVVANDIKLGHELTNKESGVTAPVKTMIITGPNTGGKTVQLKTLGLCTLMCRAGLHLPVAEESVIADYEWVLADIGDAQSLTQSLSTFSGHINRISRFLEQQEKLSKALVLMDELGTGTDPEEGAALASAILDALYEHGATTVATTHLGSLKVSAWKKEGFINASVEFNPESLAPTYRLLMGTPGSSNALTIARRIGLSEGLIESARNYLSQPVRDTGKMLEDLETRQIKLDETLAMAERFKEEAKAAYEKIETERHRIESEKRQTVHQFKSSLKANINQLDSELKTLRKRVRANKKKDPDKLAKNLNQLDQQSSEVFQQSLDSIEGIKSLTVDEVKLGQEVYSKKLNVIGEVAGVSGNQVDIQVGLIKMTVPVDDLQATLTKARNKPASQQKKTTASSTRMVLSKQVSLECDVRGQRVDEALDNIERYLDDVLLAGAERVGIIHGHGTGALKKALREYFKNSSVVKKYYPAEAMDGGDGKTILEL